MWTDLFVNTREQKASFMYIHVIVFFFKTIFIKSADRDVTSPVLHENNVTFWSETDYSLSVVFTCIDNISFNFSASEQPFSLPKINGYSGLVLRFIRS